MRLVILGATGSIGESTYKVWHEHRDRIQVEGLAAHRNGEQLWAMGLKMGAAWIALTDEQAARELTRSHGGEPGPQIVVGGDSLVEQISSANATHVLGAMSGFAGLRPTLAALKRGMRVLLANKETLVAAGDLVQRTAAMGHGSLVPVDSEHSAIFQCLRGNQPVSRIILTCSGGPFRGRSRADLQAVTVEEALHHPNWSMGKKITVDSATLMNKGLEVIEAHYLFGVDYDAIEVVVHPESVVHSMVEYVDGAIMAQCGIPDMRIPIEVALAWPERWSLTVEPFQWAGRHLHFEAPDLKTFTALSLAYQAGRSGGLYPAVLSAANEVAVEAFLEGRIPFLRIAEIVEETLSGFQPSGPADNLDEVIAADHWARQRALALSLN
ncbi:1-deoxy-D-xylulose-5-phosphate reductoisomerase [Sulfobacillus harzensis]|uniref:1-deoxy-D-xylulose 5-phosphate reductoisomerase n=1 Tax=Sulfobacillus harzensis TaxID=2729629 RepID=A0A7Y0L1Z8_9FIRM|nr:1-deoxy-D-xylulose-5-phosphate reductoisomerase [Sulfobacillus harzensis]NMP21822.1 1-deoxy-D-xylulose-5-phosphate reductoisomerase [Sulfobacillus harzensis]